MTLYTLEDVEREQEKGIIKEARTLNTLKTGVYSIVSAGFLALGIDGIYAGMKECLETGQYAPGIVMFGSSIGAGMLAYGSLNRRRELSDRLNEL